MAADLILHEHRKCPDIFCDPDDEKIGRLKPESTVALRRTADLLRVPPEDLQELTDSGALPTTTDTQGRDAVRASDLQRFHAELRPVAFTESVDADEDEDADDGDYDEEEDAEAVPVAPVPARLRRSKVAPVAVAAGDAPVASAAAPAAPVAVGDAPAVLPDATATRTNPAVEPSDAEPEAGWVRLRLSDLAALLRGTAGSDTGR